MTVIKTYNDYHHTLLLYVWCTKLCHVIPCWCHSCCHMLMSCYHMWISRHDIICGYCIMISHVDVMSWHVMPCWCHDVTCGCHIMTYDNMLMSGCHVMTCDNMLMSCHDISCGCCVMACDTMSWHVITWCHDITYMLSYVDIFT